MGGGDLNLKKSWHPHTMKNQERVWKAEQEKKQEEEKLRDLRKEIEEERSREDLKLHGQTSGVLDKPQDKKMEWMYKNSKELINREEYLLGRTIDKTFEQLEAEEKQANVVGMQKPINHVEHECIPFSIRNYKDANTNEQVDLQRKRMEDPLLLIKEKEMESRRKLLENPVRLKELHRLLKQDQELKKLSKQRKAKKSKKSKKKKKKKSKSDSSSCDSDDDSVSDLDERLRHKYEKLKGAGNQNEDNAMEAGIAKLLGSKYDAITRHLDEMVKKNKKKKKRRDSSSSSEDSAAEEDRRRQRNRQDSRKDSRRSVERRDDRRRSRSPRQHDRRTEDRRRSSRSPQRHHKERGRYEKESRIAKRHSSRSASREYSRRKSRSRSPLKSRPAHRSRSRSKDRSRRRSKSPAHKNPFNNQMAQGQRKNSPPPAKPTAKAATKLTEEEKEARRREMMQNAAWREADRSQAVQKHREAYAREEQQHKDADFDKDFLNKQVKKAISNQTSVGSRLRANLNNIQRMSSSMDSNFARK